MSSHRMRPVAVAKKSDALQQVAGRNSAGGKDDFFARRQIFGPVDFIWIGDAHALHTPPRFHIVDHQPPTISPWRQRMAAAVITPSGAPPIPITA